MSFKFEENYQLKKLIDEKYISVVKHPTEDLFIYNYTQKTQFENNWNFWTKKCRGLILDSNYNIIQKPFEKFFNVEQFEGGLPSTDFEVYEKLDGSLGILYWVNDYPYIATRGSFTSSQAIYANQNLVPKYLDYLLKLDKKYTYLFEIIYPENRIVVDYKNQERLVLLAAVLINDSVHGELPVQLIDYPDKVKLFDGLKDFEIIKQQQNATDEGFVLVFQDGLRLKYKFDEYVRLHRILTNITSYSVWEYLKDAKDFNEIIEKVPDEFYDWLHKIKNEIEDQFKKEYSVVTEAFSKIDKNIDRKSQSIFINQNYKNIAKLLFALLDNQNIDKAIWLKAKPPFSKALKNDEI